jgi:hypothetical protein
MGHDSAICSGCNLNCECGHPCWEHHSPMASCARTCCMNRVCDEICTGYREKVLGLWARLLLRTGVCRRNDDGTLRWPFAIGSWWDFKCQIRCLLRGRWCDSILPRRWGFCFYTFEFWQRGLTKWFSLD